MVAARKLYPEAAICLGGAVNRNVREFQRAATPTDPDRRRGRRRARRGPPADPRRDRARRTASASSGRCCERDDVEVVVFDHHDLDAPPPGFVDAREPGHHVRRRLARDPDAAHHRRARHRGDAARGDRLRARHPRGHGLAHLPDDHAVRDAEALAFCMRHGANQHCSSSTSRNAAQRAAARPLAAALDTVRDARGCRRRRARRRRPRGPSTSRA